MEDEKLIECVQAMPTLYDRKDSKHNNRDYVQHLWEIIARQLSEEVEVVKKRWAYLRDYFRKQRRAMGSEKPGQTGARKRKWALYDTMTFLIPYTEFPETMGDSSLDETFVEDDKRSVFAEFSESSPSTSVEEQTENTFKQPDIAVLKNQSSKRMKKEIFDNNVELLNGSKEPQKEEDENELFLKSLLPMMRSLDPLDGLKFRYEVQGLLIKYVELSRPYSTHIQLPREGKEEIETND